MEIQMYFVMYFLIDRLHLLQGCKVIERIKVTFPANPHLNWLDPYFNKFESQQIFFAVLNLISLDWESDTLITRKLIQYILLQRSFKKPYKLRGMTVTNFLLKIFE